MLESFAVRNFRFKVHLQLTNKLIRMCNIFPQGFGIVGFVDILKSWRSHFPGFITWIKSWDMKVGVSIFWDAKNTQEDDISRKSSKKAQRDVTANLLDISVLKWLKDFGLIFYECDRKNGVFRIGWKKDRDASVTVDWNSDFTTSLMAGLVSSPMFLRKALFGWSLSKM